MVERERSCPVVTTSAELVVVGLQQGLGNVPWLTAGQLLTGAFFLRLAVAAPAASVAAAAIATAAVAAAWQINIVLRVGGAGTIQRSDQTLCAPATLPTRHHLTCSLLSA